MPFLDRLEGQSGAACDGNEDELAKDRFIQSNQCLKSTVLWRFFALTFALAIPFWLLGARLPLQLLPGLPIAAFQFVCPGLAALLLVGHQGGRTGVYAFVARALDFQRGKSAATFLLVFLIMPALAVTSFCYMRLIGTAVPFEVDLAAAPVLLLLFAISAVAEELGWSGCATEPLVARFGPLRAGLFLGVVWAAFHVVPLLQVHRSPVWIAWWALGTVAARVIIVSLYLRTGRTILAAAIFHMMANVVWQMFPVHGSFYDPRVMGLLTAAAAVAETFLHERRDQRPVCTVSTNDEIDHS